MKDINRMTSASSQVSGMSADLTAVYNIPLYTKKSTHKLM